MVEAVEKETRDQSHSKLWYRYRAGRVTASKMKAICRMNTDQPSQSLIKSICYTETLLVQQAGGVPMSVLPARLGDGSRGI